jgi:hypothetical protein
MMRTSIRRVLGLGLLAASLSVSTPAGWAQPKRGAAPAGSPGIPTEPQPVIEQPDAERTMREFSTVLDHYPPTLRGVFQLDPSLLGNPSYLAPYPALASFLDAHPEVVRDPVFYVGSPGSWGRNRTQETWQDVLTGMAVFLGFGMAIGLLTWLIRTFIDYRRWSRLAKVQTDVHAKLLDRFTGNEDLLAYIQSPAGSKFLESSPISLDAGPRSVGAPLGRILWSGQAGVVLAAAGVGLLFVSGQVAGDASQPFHAMGIFGIALGIGFVVSAIISFMISQRLGLIERGAALPRAERPGAQG